MLPLVVNRLYAPDIDLATHRVTRWLPLSTAAELPLSLVWIALLSRRLKCSRAGSSDAPARAALALPALADPRV